MPDSDLTVVIKTLLNGVVDSVYVFEAVGDIEVTDSVELSTEPGVMGRIGAKFPRSGSFRVRVHDNDPRTPNHQKARNQHDLLRSFIGKLLYLDARASPPEKIIWTIENVKGVDDNSAKNAYDVDVTAREIVGGEFGEFIDPDELSTEKGLVPLQAVDPTVLGVGATTCAIATTSVIPASSVKRLSERDRKSVLSAYVSSTHGNTNPLLPDWIVHIREMRSGPFVNVPNAHIQTRDFLRTLLPPDCQIASIETVLRPDMTDLTYACQDLTLGAGKITLSFEKGENRAFKGLDVGVHAAGEAASPPSVLGTPPAPIFIGDALDPALRQAIILVGDPYNGEKKGVPGFTAGRLIVIIRGNFH